MRTYIAIDLKSFFASVECRKRNLDALKTNLVVADAERTEKTICLAVTPSLKRYGIGGRARLFEVVRKVREVNARRRAAIHGNSFRGKSCNADELDSNPYLELGYIIATPCMADYIKTSTFIYSIYLKYVAKEDIHVYSIDEVFMDVTDYLNTYGLTARELAMKIILDVFHRTKITATAGIGTNLYLCKIAMDVMAKKIPADSNGARIAELDEMSYREMLWEHRPITDFWRVGKGIAQRLEKYGLFTMGDIALQSVTDEEVLYREFGVNAELLIDHSWGYEPVGMKEIKSYKPENSSLSNGQVFSEPFSFDRTLLCTKEMADILALELVSKDLVADQIVLTVNYDTVNLTDRNKTYSGEVCLNYYGKKVPKEAHGSINLGEFTSSGTLIVKKTSELFCSIANRNLLCRRMTVCVKHVVPRDVSKRADYQPSLFDEPAQSPVDSEREKKVQEAAVALKKKYGKNTILKTFLS
ncbi:MAG: DNA methylase [Sphaerochaetaceae bacterium]|nr:DNA methylase [Sphaerochaetaceae bacterium]